MAHPERLKPFDVKLRYTDRHRLPQDVEKELNLTYHPNVKSMVRVCDVVTINAPLHPETEHLFNDALIGKMKRGAYLVNTARGKICDRDAVVRALNSWQLAGYAGDVWFPQPPPKDHPWRTMPHHGMTPHTSGTSLSAQARYAAGTREIRIRACPTRAHYDVATLLLWSCLQPVSNLPIETHFRQADRLRNDESVGRRD